MLLHLIVLKLWFVKKINIYFKSVVCNVWATNVTKLINWKNIIVFLFIYKFGFFGYLSKLGLMGV